MNRQIHSFLLFVLFILSGILLYRTERNRVVYVDSVQLLNQYEGMKVARAAYRTKANRWQAQVDTLAQEVQQAIVAYEAIGSSASTTQRAAAKQAIQVRQQHLRTFQQSIQSTAQQEDQQATQSVLQQVNAQLALYGKEHGYQLMLVANQTGTIAYAEPGLDITKDVVRYLNEQYRPSKQ